MLPDVLVLLILSFLPCGYHHTISRKFKNILLSETYPPVVRESVPRPFSEWCWLPRCPKKWVGRTDYMDGVPRGSLCTDRVYYGIDYLGRPFVIFHGTVAFFQRYPKLRNHWVVGNSRKDEPLWYSGRVLTFRL